MTSFEDRLRDRLPLPIPLEDTPFFTNDLNFLEPPVLDNGLLDISETPANLVPIVQANSSSLLLKLPAELRDHIWKYVLGNLEIHIICQDKDFVEMCDLEFKDRHDLTTKTAFGVPSVCHQIYSETCTLTYSLNNIRFCKFQFFDWNSWWLQERIPAQIEAIRRLEFRHQDPVAPLNHADCINLCAHFPSLRRLTLTFDSGIRVPDNEPLSYQAYRSPAFLGQPPAWNREIDIYDYFLPDENEREGRRERI